MTLLDTMVVVYARTPDSPFHQWAKEQIAGAVVGGGAAINAVTLAELCAEDGVDSSSLLQNVLDIGIHVLDLPASAAARCGEAYRAYRKQRKKESGKDTPKCHCRIFSLARTPRSWDGNWPRMIRSVSETILMLN